MKIDTLKFLCATVGTFSPRKQLGGWGGAWEEGTQEGKGLIFASIIKVSSTFIAIESSGNRFLYVTVVFNRTPNDLVDV